MKRNKKALFFCLCAMCAIQTLPVSAAVTETTASISSFTITSRSDKIIWKYKIVDGKKYMRQYNESTKKWIGEWILVK